jgi:hypothetical protein
MKGPVLWWWCMQPNQTPAANSRQESRGRQNQQTGAHLHIQDIFHVHYALGQDNVQPAACAPSVQQQAQRACPATHTFVSRVKPDQHNVSPSPAAVQSTAAAPPAHHLTPVHTQRHTHQPGSRQPISKQPMPVSHLVGLLYNQPPQHLLHVA